MTMTPVSNTSVLAEFVGGSQTDVAMMIGVLLKRRPLQPCSRYATGDAKVEGVSCDLCTHFSRECDRKPEAVAEQEGESS